LTDFAAGVAAFSNPFSSPTTSGGRPTMVLGSLPSVRSPKARSAWAAASFWMVSACGASTMAIA
jgi:hypothetical protein